MKNPVAFLIEQAGISVREFERTFHLSHTALIETVAGSFDNIPPRIEDSLYDLLEDKGIDVAASLLGEYQVRRLVNAYGLWRVAERRKSGDRVRGVDPANLGWSQNIPPALAFVRAASESATGFSKQMKVPQSTVRRWVSGQTKGIPNAIYEALVDVDYPHIKSLIEVQSQWQENWG